MDELKGGFNMVGFSQGGQFLRVSDSCGNQMVHPGNRNVCWLVGWWCAVLAAL
jgi:hypothetical protein